MAIEVLAPTQVTVPNGAGDTYFPNSGGVPMPAGLSAFQLLIDTSAMPAGNSFEAAAEGLSGGVWTQLSGAGVVGGQHAIKGSAATTPDVAMVGAIPQDALYPTAARVHTWNASGRSTVTVSGEAT